jgi:hypothetical protein
LRLPKKAGAPPETWSETPRESSPASRFFLSRLIFATRQLSAAIGVDDLFELPPPASRLSISRQITWSCPEQSAPLRNIPGFVCSELGRAGSSPFASRLKWPLARLQARRIPRTVLQRVHRCRDAALMHPGQRRPMKRRPFWVGSRKHGRRRGWTDQLSC